MAVAENSRNQTGIKAVSAGQLSQLVEIVMFRSIS